MLHKMMNKYSYITAVPEIENFLLIFFLFFQVKTMLSLVEEDRNSLQSKLSDEVAARHELEGG